MQYENIKDRYPCFICTETFMTRDDFDSHLTACVREAATILYSLERDFESAKSAFAEERRR